jgi:PAS domain S-box-containing protein
MLLPSDHAEIPAFLAGKGEMCGRVRAHDWSETPLGPVEGWPQSLRSLVGLILQARQPMFLAWGPALTLLYNDDYAQILGAKHPRALGEAFAVAWADIWPQFGPLVDRVMGGEAISFDDLPIPMRRNGYPEDTWFSFSYTPVRDESGAIAGLFCACTETTDKVRGEQALRANEALLEARVAERTAELDRVWRNSRDLLVVVGADGVFRAVNPAWTAVLGHQPEEVVGRHFRDFIWPEDAAPTQAALDQAAGCDDLTDFENRYRHKDGTPRWISWRTSEEGGLVYCYGRDITAEKEQAEALRRAEEDLRQAQKMEAVGQLTGGLAHDFNNLLTGIVGSLGLIDRRIAQGRLEELGRYVAAARGAADRAAALTHRLLAFSRRQTLDPRPTDVNHLVAGMEELIRRTMGPAIAVEVAAAEGLWATLVDANQLENALLNLCINARDAMPDGGRLTIETAPVTLDERAAREQDIAPGQYVSLSVTDTGIGMSPEVIAHAFDPFFTTKPLGQGTGLGLSMIYGFARQSGGQVRIRSELGQGTRMQLLLPRHASEAERPDAAAQTAEAPPAGRGETVLVVDDEPMVRMLAAEVLREQGYTVLEAEEGAAGLDLLRSRRPVDLLITDVGLPGGMNGRQLADAARRLRPALKVLFITGYADVVVAGRGQMEAGMHVMTKPFTLEALAARVKGLIDGSDTGRQKS